jgi:hypothetical protein
VHATFDAAGWDWGSAGRRTTDDAEPPVVTASGFSPLVREEELVDGTIELELAVSADRAFHGVVWRLRDHESYESFFVGPHQVGNPDSIQYTPGLERASPAPRSTHRWRARS